MGRVTGLFVTHVLTYFSLNSLPLSKVFRGKLGDISPSLVSVTLVLPPTSVADSASFENFKLTTSKVGLSFYGGPGTSLYFASTGHYCRGEPRSLRDPSLVACGRAVCLAAHHLYLVVLSSVATGSGRKGRHTTHLGCLVPNNWAGTGPGGAVTWKGRAVGPCHYRLTAYGNRSGERSSPRVSSVQYRKTTLVQYVWVSY